METYIHILVYIGYVSISSVIAYPLLKRKSQLPNGGVVDMVHFGYITPEEIHSSVAYDYLSPSDKLNMPEPSIPKTAIFYWDYFEIKRAD